MVTLSSSAKNLVVAEGKIYIPQSAWAKVKKQVTSRVSKLAARNTKHTNLWLRGLKSACGQANSSVSEHSALRIIESSRESATQCCLSSSMTNIREWLLDCHRIVNHFYDRFTSRLAQQQLTLYEFTTNIGDDTLVKYCCGNWSITMDDNYNTIYIEAWEPGCDYYDRLTTDVSAISMFGEMATAVVVSGLWDILADLADVKYYGTSGGVINLFYDDKRPIVFGNGEKALPYLRTANRSVPVVPSDPRFCNNA